MGYRGETTPPHNKTAPQAVVSPVASTGVLLTNLGTPDKPEPAALRRYLKQFLSDPRVVEIPRFIWWFILHLLILPLRPRVSAKLYRQIWTENGSPLLDISHRQAAALQQQLNQSYGEGNVVVELGMRYGNPSIGSALNALAERKVRDITVLPLYPQYSGSTTGSTFDEVSAELSRYRWVPELTFINGYQNHPGYIDALCQSVKQHIEQHGMPERFIFSYHGTPQRYLDQGDPYHCFCQQTTRLVREQLAYSQIESNEELIMTTFQSRFGKATWLRPYTDKTLQALAAEGVRHVAIICPGFSADCLETLEEIEVENRQTFIDAGGEQYHYIPCLNDSAAHIEMMAELVSKSW